MLIGEALRAGTALLKQRYVESAALDCALILGKLTHLTRTQLLSHDAEALSEEQAEAFFSLLEKRSTGYPVAYILGYKEFYGLSLKVTEQTLIPRPDTETLVEEALKLDGVQEVLDLGTGSGAIILALKSQRPDWQCEACDLSSEALSVAQDNATSLGLEIAFQHSDWFSAYSGRRFSLLVSNPPYIASGDECLQETSLPFEPRKALVSGPEGEDAIRHLITQAPRYLKPGGVLMLEHGFAQGPLCRSLLSEFFPTVYTVRDLGGQERVSVGRL